MVKSIILVTMSKWKLKMIGLAKHVATWSKDKSTQVGAVIVNDRGTVLSMGYNGFARGVNDNIPLRDERPLKYSYTPHAEANAIYNAAAEGVSLRDASIYVTLFTCSGCANAIVQSGIIKVYVPEIDESHERDQRWMDEFKIAKTILDEGKVEIEFY